MQIFGTRDKTPQDEERFDGLLFLAFTTKDCRESKTRISESFSKTETDVTSSLPPSVQRTTSMIPRLRIPPGWTWKRCTACLMKSDEMRNARCAHVVFSSKRESQIALVENPSLVLGARLKKINHLLLTTTSCWRCTRP